MSEKRISFSMVTFFYNEEEDILQYLETVTEKFESISKKWNCDYEIVLVDDGSSDDSKQIVEAFIKEHQNIHIILHSYPENKGIGHALFEGLKLCNNEYIFWNDVDLHFDILDVDKIISLLRRDTIVVTYKSNVKYKKFIPWFVSRTNYYLLKFGFYPKIKDFQFVQFYPTSYINKIDIISRSSLIACELLTKSKRLGYRIQQIPVFYHRAPHARKSKCMSLKNIFFTLKDILNLKYQLTLRAGIKDSLPSSCYEHEVTPYSEQN